MFKLVGRFNFTSPKYGLKGMPEIFIGDKLGMIREKLIGSAERDISENIQMLRKYINE